MYSNFELLIETNHELLTKNEIVIANYIIANPEIIIATDIVTAAGAMYISKSTLTRFCIKIGLDNYKELKYILKQSKQENTITKKVLDNTLDLFYADYSIILNKFKLTVDDKAIEKTVNYIKKANQIYIIGIGQSGYLAENFAIRLRRLGLNVTALTDIHIIQMICNICTSSDVFLFISNSGKTKIINTALIQVNQVKCKSILLTEFNQSNASKHATVTILIPQKSKLELANSISDTFALGLVSDIIFHYIYISDEKYQKIYTNTLIDHNEI